MADQLGGAQPPPSAEEELAIRQREAERARQIDQADALVASERDMARARDGAAAEAARVAREWAEARSSPGGAASPKSKASRKERKAMSAAQKAAINMGVREWLGGLSTLLVDDMDSALGEAVCDGGEALAEIFEYVDCFTMLALLAKADDILALQELCCDQLGEPMLQDDVLAELWAHLAPLMDENKSAIAKERKEQASLSKKVKAEHAKEEKQAEKLKRKQQKKDKKKKKKKGK